MTIDMLQNEKISAMKNGDMARRDTISDMIDSIQKASITSAGRVEITDKLIDEVLIKYQKTVQEMIDTCPADRAEHMAEYQNTMAIVKEFAPQLIADEPGVKQFLLDTLSNFGLELTKKNRGAIMKIVAPVAKGKVDMKMVNTILSNMLV